jgi:autotransporter-associated beta strand protein
LSGNSLHSVVGATLDLNDFSQAIGALSGSGGVTLGSATLTTGSTAGSTFSGTISSGTGGGLTKVGATTFILSGISSYDGQTTVSAGTLQGGALNAFSGPSFHQVDATLDLGGFNQTIGGLSGSSGSAVIALGTNTLQISTGSPGSYAGTITGTTGGLTVDTIDVLTLTQTNGCTYGGITNVLNVSGTLRAGAVNVLAPTSEHTLQGTLDLNNFNQTIGKLSSGTNSGTVTLGSGTLTCGSTGASDFGGVISGVGGNLTKVGATTFILSGNFNNTYTGLTTVSDGTLELSKGAAIAIAGDLTIASPATLDVMQDNQFASTSTVTLNGTFNMNNRTLTIGSLAYQSGTFNSGIVPLTLASSVTPLSMQTVTLDQDLIFSGTGGTITRIAAGAGNSTIGPATFQLGGGTYTFDSLNGNFAMNSGISESAQSNIVKTGSGILRLINTNAYSGTTTINQGTIRTEVVNALPPATDVTINGAILNLSSNDQTIGSVAGTGSVTLGTATLTTGSTISTTYAGAITGAGSLTKVGGTNFILSGAGNSIGGTTTVSAGRLSINGALTSTTATDVSGTLGGTGTLTSNLTTIMNGGTLSPGNSIGTLTIIGPVVQASGSTLEIEVTPNPLVRDLLSIQNPGGSYTIQPGATLLIIPAAGIYPSTFTTMIVDAPAGTLTGTFSNIIITLPTFQATVNYDSGAGDVILTNITLLPFASVITEGDAEQVAHCVDTLASTPGSDAELVNAELRQIPTIEGLAAALDLLQPSQYTAFALAQENATLYTNDTLFYRLLQNTRSCPIPCRAKTPEIKERSKWQKLTNQKAKQDKEKEAEIVCPEEKSRALWVTPFGGLSYQSEQNGQPGFDTRTGGITAGMDFNPSKRWTAGGALGYSYIHLDWDGSRGNSHMHNGYAALYTGLTGKYAYLFGSAIGSYNHYDASRHIVIDNDAIMDINRHARSSHNGWQASGHLQSGLLFGKKMQISPFVRTDYLFVHQGSFTEHNAQSLNLHVQKENSDLLELEAGIQLSRCFSVSNNSASPFFGISVIREWRFMGKHYHSSFQDSSCVMDTTGMKPDRTLISPEGGLTWLIPNENCTLSLDYKGKFGEKFQDNRILAQFLFRF